MERPHLSAQKGVAHCMVGKSKWHIQRKQKECECAGTDLYSEIVEQQVGKLGTQQL